MTTLAHALVGPSGADDLLARAFNESSEACETKSAPPLAEEETTQRRVIVPPPTSITCVDGTLEIANLRILW